MVEVIKHIMGVCGEHWHPNIWTAAMASPMLSYLVYYIKDKL